MTPPSPTDRAADEFLAALDEPVRTLVARLRDAVRETLPALAEEADPKDRLLGYTTAPGTYRGLVVAVVAHRAHVNLMFARGAELAGNGDDPHGLLTGTGKKARHGTARSTADVDHPGLRDLIAAAGRLHGS